MNCPRSTAPAQEKEVVISGDGVSETKSTSVSLDVHTLKFKQCRTIYPLRVVRPLNKFPVDHRKQMEKVLLDLHSNNCIIRTFIGDNPIRSRLREALSHSSYFPCEYCDCKGILSNENASSEASQANLEYQRDILQQQINNLTANGQEEEAEIFESLLSKLNEARKNKSRQIVWPASTRNSGKLRTKQDILETANKIEMFKNGELPNDLSQNEKRGIVGKSLFLDLEYFDFILDMPTDYLHLSCLGVVKRLMELTFNVGANRKRVTKRKLSSPSLYNKEMKKVKVFKECSRRSRELDFAVFKGQEFRNISLLFFKAIINCIEEKYDEERAIWLLLSFVLRACIIPDPEFEYVDQNIIKICCNEFYKLYERNFGLNNCTYSLHVLASHLLELRKKGPLTETSAFIFESFYGELRNSFCPGTNSPLKQTFQNIYLKRMLSFHSCEAPIALCNHDTALECNTIVYTYEQNNYEFHKIVDIEDEDLICHKINKSICKFNACEIMDWKTVGVFKMKGYSQDMIKIKKHTVMGKGLIVDDILLSCPYNVLQEK